MDDVTPEHFFVMVHRLLLLTTPKTLMFRQCKWQLQIAGSDTKTPWLVFNIPRDSLGRLSRGITALRRYHDVALT